MVELFQFHLISRLPRSGFLFRLFCIVVAASLAAAAVRAADFSPEAGRPVFRNFRPTEYRGHPQVYNIVLHRNGFVYFSSEQGIIEFDGTRWRHLRAPCPMVFQLVADQSGRLWITGMDEIGYYEPDRDGAWNYHSVAASLPSAFRPLGASRSLVEHEGALCFTNPAGVARWKDGRVDTWPGDGPRELVFSLHGSLYAAVPTRAPRRLVGDRFERLPAPPADLTRSTWVTALPRANGHILWAWDDAGFFDFDPASGTWTPFPTPARELLRGSRVTCSLVLPDQTIALGTTSRGVLLLSENGRQLRRYDRSHGLIDNVVLSLMHDRDGGLWLGLNTGAARLEIDSPVSVYDAANGLAPGTIDIWGRHQGRLYAGAADGVYLLQPADDLAGESAHFERINDHLTNIFGLESIDGDLLVFHHQGVDRLLPDHTSEHVASLGTNGAYASVPSRLVPGRIYASGRTGLSVLEKHGGQWKVVYENTTLGDAHTAIEDRNGDVWLGTYSRGFWRLPAAHLIADWGDADRRFEHYHRNRGLPENYAWTNVYLTPDGPGFFTSHGNRRFDPSTRRFNPNNQFRINGRVPTAIYPEITTAAGDTWCSVYGESTIATDYPLGRFVHKSDGTYQWQTAPAGAVREIGFAGVAVAHLESSPAGEVLWARGYDNMIRLDLSRPIPAPTRWSAQIRSVDAEGGQIAHAAGAAPLRFGYSHDPVIFRVAAPRYRALDDTRFQTRLLGFSEKWSPPSAIAEASYTNLEGGPFTFEARAVDLEGSLSDTARLTFSVAPPWHRSTVAFLAYGLAGLGGVAGLMRWRLSRAQREQARLEELVARRTAELDAANKAKSTFLANMSHELRTPLNGVIGYAQVLQKSSHIVAQDRERLRIVQTSGEHLLRMINEVLDFSKIEAGKLDLRPAPFNLPQLLRDVFTAFESRAIQKQLHFSLEISHDLPATVIGDAQKLRQVLDNLLGNAVKFTAHGAVVLRAFPARSHVAFAVEDTGVGLTERDQAGLFQPFHQPVDGRPPEPGTGLGLAIARRLVELMGGSLMVESTAGVGSTFSFSLPLEALAAGTHDAQPVAPPPIGYHGERRRLLVVDDVAVNRAVIVELLQPLGFILREATGGEEALALLPGFKPHLVFLDLRMPGMDGLELAKRLRALPRENAPLALVAMSASVLSFNRDSALEAGCDDFLPKPFREAELIAKLTMHLGVVWRHGDTSHPFPVAPQSSTAALLDLRALLEIAKRGEIRSLREQLAALRKIHPSDARLAELENLARDYQMERVRAQLANFLNATAPS